MNMIELTNQTKKLENTWALFVREIDEYHADGIDGIARLSGLTERAQWRGTDPTCSKRIADLQREIIEALSDIYQQEIAGRILGLVHEFDAWDRVTAKTAKHVAWKAGQEANATPVNTVRDYIDREEMVAVCARHERRLERFLTEHPNNDPKANAAISRFGVRRGINAALDRFIHGGKYASALLDEKGYPEDADRTDGNVADLRFLQFAGEIARDLKRWGYARNVELYGVDGPEGAQRDAEFIVEPIGRGDASAARAKIAVFGRLSEIVKEG